MTQTEHQLIEPAHRLGIGLWLGRIGMHDQVQAPLEVVEYRDFLAQHQERIGRAELIGLVVHRKTRLDPANGLETEISDQSAGECGQAFELWHPVLLAQGFDLGQRIGKLARLHHLAQFLDAERVAAKGIHAPTRQADDGMTAPVLAAFHRLEQIGIRAIGELEIHRQRRVQVRQHFARHRNAVVALRGERIELLLADHGTQASQGGGPRR